MPTPGPARLETPNPASIVVKMLAKPKIRLNIPSRYKQNRILADATISSRKKKILSDNLWVKVRLSTLIPIQPKINVYCPPAWKPEIDSENRNGMPITNQGRNAPRIMPKSPPKTQFDQ
ncbi:hypothetical protein A2691_04830 [Candidatus Woesebacteria bacterium RIFCSPHIGHO2_01_FULL_39_23]|nr:MAG: hypothetical protein A2691_04830 [Candidatus Woesebacteria bacterium RIFCSPHIGHO2_01_FULL_39_23]